jgi:hypothetical protein
MSCPMMRCPYFKIFYLFLYIPIDCEGQKNIEILSLSFVNPLFLTWYHSKVLEFKLLFSPSCFGLCLLCFFSFATCLGPIPLIGD